MAGETHFPRTSSMSSSGAEPLLPAGRFALHRREQPGAMLGTRLANSACAIACRSMVYRWLRIKVLCREPDFQLIKLSYPADRSTLSETKPYRRNAPIPRAFERASYFCAVRRSSASNLAKPAAEARHAQATAA